MMNLVLLKPSNISFENSVNPAQLALKRAELDLQCFNLNHASELDGGEVYM